MKDIIIVGGSSSGVYLGEKLSIKENRINIVDKNSGPLYKTKVSLVTQAQLDKQSVYYKGLPKEAINTIHFYKGDNCLARTRLNTPVYFIDESPKYAKAYISIIQDSKFYWNSSVADITNSTVEIVGENIKADTIIFTDSHLSLSDKIFKNKGGKDIRLLIQADVETGTYLRDNALIVRTTKDGVLYEVKLEMSSHYFYYTKNLREHSFLHDYLIKEYYYPNINDINTTSIVMLDEDERDIVKDSMFIAGGSLRLFNPLTMTHRYDSSLADDLLIDVISNGKSTKEYKDKVRILSNKIRYLQSVYKLIHKNIEKEPNKYLSLLGDLMGGME